MTESRPLFRIAPLRYRLTAQSVLLNAAAPGQDELLARIQSAPRLLEYRVNMSTCTMAIWRQLGAPDRNELFIPKDLLVWTLRVSRRESTVSAQLSFSRAKDSPAVSTPGWTVDEWRWFDENLMRVDPDHPLFQMVPVISIGAA